MSCPDCCACEPQCAPGVSLDEWREILSYNPFYFWQLAQNKLDYANTPIPDDQSNCNPLGYKKGWQAGTVGRDEVWRALIRAEQQFAEFACYYPFPTYDCHEQVFLKTKLTHCWGKPLRFRLPKRKLLGIGAETLTPLNIGLPVPVVPFSSPIDKDGDGVPDWIEFRFTDFDPTVLTSEMEVYFEEDDWCDKPLCRNRIWPLCIERDTDTGEIVVSGHSWLFVRPILYGNQAQKALDPGDTSIYPRHVNVFRRWTDPTNAVRLMRKPGHCKCDPADQECYVIDDTGELCIVDAERGIVEIKIPTTTCACPECVDRICIDYISGDCGNEELLSRLAAANLGRQVCCCENHEVRYWMEDFVGVDDRGRIASPLSVVERANQFGTRRGQISAYKTLRPRRPAKVARI